MSVISPNIDPVVDVTPSHSYDPVQSPQAMMSTACDPAPNASLGDDKASPKDAVQQTQEERERILQWARDIVKKYPYQPRKVRQEAARAKHQLNFCEQCGRSTLQDST